eukprot:Colp12_sorted_trinity150504_noHs@9550
MNSLVTPNMANFVNNLALLASRMVKLSPQSQFVFAQVLEAYKEKPDVRNLASDKLTYQLLSSLKTLNTTLDDTTKSMIIETLCVLERQSEHLSIASTSTNEQYSQLTDAGGMSSMPLGTIGARQQPQFYVLADSRTDGSRKSKRSYSLMESENTPLPTNFPPSVDDALKKGQMPPQVRHLFIRHLVDFWFDDMISQPRPDYDQLAHAVVRKWPFLEDPADVKDQIRARFQYVRKQRNLGVDDKLKQTKTSHSHAHTHTHIDDQSTGSPVSTQTQGQSPTMPSTLHAQQLHAHSQQLQAQLQIQPQQIQPQQIQPQHLQIQPQAISTQTIGGAGQTIAHIAASMTATIPSSLSRDFTTLQQPAPLTVSPLPRPTNSEQQ